MVRKAKNPHHMRSWRFTLVRDAHLRKVDSNTRKVHSKSTIYWICCICVCSV